MLKANKKVLIITCIVTVLPVFAGLILWNRLPDPMATHFGASGNQADGFSSKAFAIFGLPLILLAVHLLVAFITSYDPRKQNISPKMFHLVLWLVPVISLIANALTYLYNLGYKVNFTFGIGLFFSVVLIIIGNYLPKARQNYTIGIRLPWTLANEENWNRTHRLAGWLWMISGIVLAVLTILHVPAGWLIGVFASIVIIPTFYSFWLHIKKGL